MSTAKPISFLPPGTPVRDTITGLVATVVARLPGPDDCFVIALPGRRAMRLRREIKSASSK